MKKVKQQYLILKRINDHERGQAPAGIRELYNKAESGEPSDAEKVEKLKDKYPEYFMHYFFNS
jgi:hypothetical protein